jgi:hypothetical protein
MHLNADWDYKTTTNDDQTLCLDGQYFGNISRLLNYRCEYASLIDMLSSQTTKLHNILSNNFHWTLVMYYVG